MGRNQNGLHCWVTPYPSWIRLNLSHSGSVNKSCSLHSSQDNLFATNLVELYMSWVVCLHGVPKKIVSDRGSQLTPMFWEKLHESMDTKINFSSAYHPQTDGQMERTNQILEGMLRACALKYGKSWDKSLPYAEFSYNNSYQASIKMAPYEELYGRQCRTPLF
jgi:hypothetical protein